MAYKRTGNPSGRPRADRDLPLIAVDTLAGDLKFNVPIWWFVMAEKEADLKFGGKWERGSLKELAGHFVASLSDKVKSPAAVNKVRLDPRYLEAVEARLRSLKLQAWQDAQACQPVSHDREALRATIMAAILANNGDPE